MSAESPRRISRGAGTVVRPQPVSDKSVLESVVDFFQDVVPQAYSGAPKSDDKEKIQWVRFQQADANDVCNNPDVSPQSGNITPLILVLGYTNGVQLWSIPSSGEAQEILSIRQGPVKVLQILPNPEPVFEQSRGDVFERKRPLVALSDASSAGAQYCSVKFISLRSGDEVHAITFRTPVCGIHSNRRVVAITFKEEIQVFDPCKFSRRFTVTNCYPCKGPDLNPIALGSRWLAYADQKLVPVHQSCGGMTGDGAQSYAATMINAAKTLTKGLQMFSETVTSSITGARSPPTKKDVTVSDNGFTPGIVSIVDVHVIQDQFRISDDFDGEGLVAHFPAHANEPVSAMSFDPSGVLLFTACRLGQNFHIFRIMAHPWSSSLGAVHHLYTLHRGDTTAKVQDVTFTHDSRWVAVSTLRGTTHVFPITTYGGPISVRTHTSPRVVNRSSRFHKSAGIEEIERTAGRHSPVMVSGSPGTAGAHHEHYPSLMRQNVLNNNTNNPRLPPFPHATTVYPHVQIKQPMTLGTISGSSSKTSKAGQATGLTEALCVASSFGASRGWVAGSPGVTSRDKGEQNRPVDSLFVLGWGGNLIEYVLEPYAKSTGERVVDDSPITVSAVPRAQWALTRSINSIELKPPLPSNNPLILATDAVLTQQPNSVNEPALVTRHDSESSLSSDHSSIKDDEDQWLSQVEILTHAGPHRRLWMGPQFSFKTFQNQQNTTVLSSTSSALLSQSPETQLTAQDLLCDDLDLQSLQLQPTRSSPVAMPGANNTRRAQRGSTSSDTYSPSPGLCQIEAGSFEQSPNLVEVYGSWPGNAGQVPTRSGEVPEDRLRESIADAMIEAGPTHKDGGPLSGHDFPGDNGGSMGHHSSDGSSGRSRGNSFDLRSSPPHSIEHVLVFPNSSGSPDHSS